MSLLSAHITVSGRVQGVGFRYFTQEKASSLGLTGYVRNLFNGDVEIVAEGDDKTLAKFIKEIRKGPPLSNVIDVKTEWETIKTRKYKSFNITF